jgi:error-prone DNA polymerase
MVEGKLQREGEVTHVIAKRCYDMSWLLQKLVTPEEDLPQISTFSPADEKDGDRKLIKSKKPQAAKVVQGEIFPSGRNFK